MCAESQFGGFNNMLPDLYSTSLVNSSEAFFQCWTYIQNKSERLMELIFSLRCIASLVRCLCKYSFVAIKASD